MMLLTQDIKEVLNQKGYKFFDDGRTPYNLNIIGIRSANGRSGSFDDLVGVLYRNKLGIQTEVFFGATTDSGTHYLKNPLNKNGTAILLEGQYRSAFKLGIHGRTWVSGGYEALEQQKPMRYIRDNNKDNYLDIAGFEFEANLKTNIHRRSRNAIGNLIGRASAGCQVLEKEEDFNFLIGLVKLSLLQGFTNSFTYTLLHESDFDNFC